MMVWLKMGGGGMGGAENGAGQSCQRKQLWHSLAGEGALHSLLLASLACVSRRASFAVPCVRGKK